jgi:hypothetical protein
MGIHLMTGLIETKGDIAFYAGDQIEIINRIFYGNAFPSSANRTRFGPRAPLPPGKGGRERRPPLLSCFHLDHTLIPGPMIKGHKGDFLMRF